MGPSKLCLPPDTAAEGMGDFCVQPTRSLLVADCSTSLCRDMPRKSWGPVGDLMGIAGPSVYSPPELLWRMQIISLDLALANGTMLTITPQSQPHLWKAAQVALTPFSGVRL